MDATTGKKKAMKDFTKADWDRLEREAEVLLPPALLSRLAFLPLFLLAVFIEDRRRGSVCRFLGCYSWLLASSLAALSRLTVTRPGAEVPGSRSCKPLRRVH